MIVEGRPGPCQQPRRRPDGAIGHPNKFAPQKPIRTPCPQRRTARCGLKYGKIPHSECPLTVHPHRRIVRHPAGADIDHHHAGFHHLGRDQPRLPHRHDQDVRHAGVRGEVGGVLVREGDGGVRSRRHEQRHQRLADDQTPPDDDHVAALDRHGQGRYGFLLATYGGPSVLYEMDSKGNLFDMSEAAGLKVSTGGRSLLVGLETIGPGVKSPVGYTHGITSTEATAEVRASRIST